MLNDNILKIDLKDKIAPCLKHQLYSKYTRSSSLSQWVAAIQAKNQGQIAEYTIYITQQDANALRYIAFKSIGKQPPIAIVTKDY